MRTLEITDRTKNDYFTFECPISYIDDDKLPNADRYFSDVMQNKDNREYLRKVLGYLLSGDTNARCFFIMYGNGSN